MNESKHEGVSILFVSDNEEVLLFLRDNIPSIPFPGCWDVPGGHVEEGETPEDCIVREMEEEIEINIGKPALFKKTDLNDRTEYTFWKKADFNIDDINLHEGQGMKWFSEEDAKNLPEDKIYLGFKPIILEFFKEKPFNK
ncbi:MAG: NUDIX domain-containing protein [Candidatus Pacebacteria bacterium]|nr:NUDIX domain-containing protein [Candidatus Paceibacterota bacterium]MDR3583459.1 NUDIX domain-containing protein [Candidatus Paceibacterota bacterium]